MSEKEIGEIQTYCAVELTQRQIAKIHRRSQIAVGNAPSKSDSFAMKSYSRCPRKVPSFDQIHLVWDACRARESSKQLANNLQLSKSACTVWHKLLVSSIFKYHTPVYSLDLKLAINTILDRVKHCMCNEKSLWKNAVFSDKKIKYGFSSEGKLLTCAALF